MGVVRKTVSISTLGLVPFRSKKEKLAAATAQRDAAEQALKAVEKSLEAARQRVAEAELLALKEAGRANKAQRSRTKDRKRRGGAVSAAEPLSRRARKAEEKALKKAGAVAGHAVEVVEEKAEQLSRRARKQLAKTQKRAAKKAKRLRKEAEAARREAVDKAREAAAAQVGSVQAAVSGRVGDVINRSG